MTTTTTTTTMATILEMENKKTIEEKASYINAKIEKVCGYVRRTIDVKDARDYVKKVNEILDDRNIKAKFMVGPDREDDAISFGVKSTKGN